MTGFTLDHAATLTGARLVGEAVTATVLPDGSFLVAGSKVDAVHLWHLSPTLDVLGEATTTGVDPTLYPTGQGAVLLTTDGATTTARPVTVDPLTLDPGSTLPTALPLRRFGDWSPAPWVDPGTGTVYVLRRGWVHALDGTTQVDAHALPGRALVVHSGHVVNTDGTVVALDGGTSGIAPAAAVGWYALAATDPTRPSWRFVSEGEQGQVVYDAATGTVLDAYGAGDYRAGQSATTPDNGGGSLSLTVGQAPDESYHAYVDHHTPDGFTHTRHALPGAGIWDPIPGGEAMAQAGGRWVGALLVGTGAGYSLQVWTGTVPFAHHGVLDIFTLDDGWWTVGTRDPGMAYRLQGYTATGWVVEVFAGEEALATHELAVYDPTHELAGDDGWVVAALMRPE